MLVAGDELGRTQHGNNNAYCQDNELSWLDWELDRRAARAVRVHQAPAAHPPRAPGAAPLQVLPGPRHPRHRAAATCCGSATTAQPMTERRLAATRTRRAWRCSWPGAASTTSTSDGPAAGRRQPAPAAQRQRHRRSRSPCPRSSAVREPWQVLVDTARRRGRGARRSRARPRSCVARSLKFLRAPSRVIRAGRRRAHARRHLSAAAQRRVRLPATRAESSTTCATLGVTDVYTSPIFAAAPGSSARLRRGRPRAAQPRAGRARTTSTRCQRRAARARHGPAARLGAQPHGHRERAEPLVGRRARERPELAATPTSSTSTGRPLARDLRDRVLLADPGRSVRRGARARRAADRLGGAAASSSPYYERRLPLGPEDAAAAARARCASAAGARRRRSGAPASSRASCPRCGHLPDRTRPATRAQQRARAREGGHQAALCAPAARAVAAGRAARRARAGGAQRHARRRQRASTRSTACCASRAIGWPRGGWPPRRSTTGASSTSTSWRRCAWRRRRSSSRRTPLLFQLIDERRRPRRCASTTPTASTIPCAYFEALQRALPRRTAHADDAAQPRRRAPARCPSWSRRSSSAASAARRVAGRWHHRLRVRRRGGAACGSTRAPSAR